MARPIKLSATRVSSYMRCKRKYWFQYVEHMPKLSNPAFKLGTTCHETLEYAGHIWVEKGRFDEEDYKKIFDVYNKVSVSEGIESMQVHVEGKALIKNRLDNFALGRKIISLEETFGFADSRWPDLETDMGVPLIGAMDKVIEIDDDTLMIVDYKTSKTAPTPEQLQDDLQLSLYDLVAHQLWPQYERIILCLDMLRSAPVYGYRTEEQRNEISNYLVTVYDEMCKMEEKQAVASLNVFCPWCDFKDYCKEYEKACTTTGYDFLPTAKLTNDQLIEEYDQITSTARILDTRKREIAMIIMEKINNAGTNLYGENKQVYIRQNARVNYDPKVVQENTSPEEFVEMVNLKKKDVDSYCSKNPKAREKIMDGAVTNFTTPFIATKAIKK